MSYICVFTHTSGCCVGLFFLFGIQVISMEGPRRKQQKKKDGEIMTEHEKERFLVFEQSKYMSHLDRLQIVLHPTQAKTV